MFMYTAVHKCNLLIYSYLFSVQHNYSYAHVDVHNHLHACLRFYAYQDVSIDLNLFFDVCILCFNKNQTIEL